MDNLKMHFNTFFDSLDLSHLKKLCKRLLVLSIVLFILLSLFFINAVSPSAHAADSVSFPPITFSSDTSSFTSSNAFSSLPTFVTVTFSSGSSFRYTFVTSVSDTFVFAISRNIGSRPAYSLYAVSVNSSSSSDSLVYFQDTNSSVYRYSYSLNTLDSSSSTYYHPLFDIYTDNGNVISPIDFPIFSSLSSALSSFRTWYDNGGANPVDPTSKSFSVPAGYVAYAEMADPSQYVDLFVTMPFKSTIASTDNNSVIPWDTENQYFYDGLSLPSGSLSFPLSSGGTLINWNEAEPRDIFGVGVNAKARLTPSRNLICIYNPYTVFSSGSPIRAFVNGNIQVTSLSAFTSVKLFPLNDNVVYNPSNGLPSVVSSGDSSDPISGVLDDNGNVISWVDSNGDPITPVPGHGMQIPADGSNDQDVFASFFSRVEALLSNGINAIRTLVSSSSEFFSVLRELWTWLPSEVYTIIFASVILVVTIGFFKAFL